MRFPRIQLLLLSVALIAPGPEARAESSRFSLNSSACINLHHFLYHESRNQLRGEDKLRWRVRTYPEDRAVELEGEEAETWQRALESYVAYAERSLLFSRELTRVKNDCATGLSAFPRTPDAEPAYAAIRLAMPIYEKYWWPRHDALNQRRIAQLEQFLAQYENDLAEWLARDYESEWPDDPIRVDVSVYSGHHGAYATEKPNQIVFASGDDWYPGLWGLELLLHEASHTWPLNRHVRPYSEAAARDAGVDEDRLWHAYFFYAVARAADALFPPEYIPYPEHHGLWDNGLGQHYPFLKEAYSPDRGLAEEMRLIHQARAAAQSSP